MEKKLSLWDLSSELVALNELMEIDGGEITEEFEELEKSAMNELELKVDGCCEFVERNSADINAAKERIKLLRDFIKFKENKNARFEEFVKACLEKTKKASFVGQFKEIKLRKPSNIVIIDDENLIPMEFSVVETIVKIKKVEIKKALKTGKVPGARLEKGKVSVLMGLRK